MKKARLRVIETANASPDRVALGHTNKQIASDLGISTPMIGAHRQALMKKTGARETASLTRLAMGLGLVEPLKLTVKN